MQGPSWITLFERIPVTLHDSLALTLATGSEILMQSVLRLESDFVLLRGRMSGSTDAGRVLIVPYDQIVNLAFTKRMLEADVQAVFGQTLESPASLGQAGAAAGGVADAATAPGQELARPAETQPAAASAKPQAAPVPAGAAAKVPTSPPSKSILLARLRARLAEQGKQS
jgi:hypothetical protein